MDTGLKQPDEQLWKEAQAGDPSARERLFRRVESVALEALRRRKAPYDELETLALTTCEDVLAYLDQGKPIRRSLTEFVRFRSWGVLSDHRKKVRARRAHEAPSGDVERPGAGAGPLTSIMSGEAWTLYGQCVELLPKSLRQAFSLYYDGGLGVEQAAARLDTTVRAIHLRLWRARKELRECLGSKGVEPGDFA